MRSDQDLRDQDLRDQDLRDQDLTPCVWRGLSCYGLEGSWNRFDNAGMCIPGIA